MVVDILIYPDSLENENDPVVYFNSAALRSDLCHASLHSPLISEEGVGKNSLAIM